MVTVKFQGWFECRLATDPDPVDEKRGVSGYMKCLAGEPDFDRIIRFHNPMVKRQYAPTVGVYITKVFQDNTFISNHFLAGAAFNLEDSPMFYGYNGIIGDDGYEPIVPFVISIKKDDFLLQRAMIDEKPTYPFNYMKPTNGILVGGNDVCEQTGIWDIASHLNNRIKSLESDLSEQGDALNKFNIEQRLLFLKDPSGVASRFFNARMNWNFRYIRNRHPGIAGEVKIQDPNNIIKFSDNKIPWATNFWMGGWDPDGLCGYVSGILDMPSASLI